MTQSNVARIANGAPPGDADLIDAIAGGDNAAFELLYRRYAPRLHAFLQRLLSRHGLIEEVVNDSMLVVWRKARAYHACTKVSTWIFAIAQRRALKALSRSQRVVATAANEDAIDRPGPDGELQQTQLRTHVTRALAQLPVQQSVVLRLVYFEGYACREVADLMDCPVDTVKTRAFHARRKLKSMLALTQAG